MATKLSKRERDALQFYGKYTGWNSFAKDEGRTMARLAKKGLVEVVGVQARILPLNVKINVAGYEVVRQADFVGIGAYPYYCEAAEKYPNDAIYVCRDRSGWFGLRETTFDGEYHRLHPVV